MIYQIICVIIMALASFLPRMVPLVFCRKKVKSSFLKSFLYYMPYAVLSALTFPAILASTGNVWTATIGTALALIMSYFKVNLAIVAVVCTLVVFGFGFVF
ncbi:MAG: AzlD domain-containing protein [Christensenellales bacterium]